VPRLLEIKKEDFAAHYNRSVEDKKSPAISAGLLVHIDEFKRVSNASASMFRQAYRLAMNADNITKRLKKIAPHAPALTCSGPLARSPDPNAPSAPCRGP
jgi:hypothetical protein